MISVLAKPMDQIGPDDIQELIDSEVPEGEQIEFKERLPTEDGSTDPWECGADRIGRGAQKKIVEEAVAFANAYGGALVLGVRESEDEAKPGIAEGITAVPRCADLAKRLNLVFRDWVDPQIPRIEIFPVPTNGECGVVVIRTGRSRMAPHRVQPTRKCTIRRADRCEEMSMREIQDLTLNLSRGLERLERRLAQRSKRFVEELNNLESPDQAYGIRVTAAPTGEDIRFDRVSCNYQLEHNLHEPWHSILARIGNYQTRLAFPFRGGSWRSMLRSARNEYSTGSPRSELQIYREIHCDGLVEIGLVDCRVIESGIWRIPRIYCSYPVTMFANLIVWADRVRHQASVPSVEYAVDVEIYIRGGSVAVDGYGGGDAFIPPNLKNNAKLSVNYPGELLGEPRYSLREADGIPELIALFERDLWNSFGSDVGDEERHFVVEDWPAGEAGV